MNKRIFKFVSLSMMMLLVSLFGYSCSAEDTVNDSNRQIIFYCDNPDEPQTKATLVSSFTSYGVSCSAYASSGSYSSATFGNFFRALSCTNNTNTGFLWPGSSKKLSFYAYYPYGNSYVTLNSTTSNTGVPTYSYSTPTDLSKQVDFCAAQVTDVAGNYNSKVTLPFKHVCAALAFNVKNAGVDAITLKSVKFYGVKLAGTYNGSWTATGSASTASSNAMTITSNTAISGGATLDVSGSANNIILVPQTIASGTQILDVLVTINGADKHYYYNLPSALTFSAGYKYTYTISISNNITLSSASISDWNRSPINGVDMSLGSWGYPAEKTPVDLGLPSGTLWAAGNVGANSPQDHGLYFAWGETVGYTAEQVTAGERKFDTSSYTASSEMSDLTLEQDAARANLGGSWRMPTKAECQELIDNCNSTWTTNYNNTGVAGRMFTSKINGNSVFFPAAGSCINSSFVSQGSYGYYLTSSWRSYKTAYLLRFNSGSAIISYDDWYLGNFVRGVIPPAQSMPVDLGLPSGLKWAAGNIGAKNPEDYGLYFAWGETTGYTAAQVTGGERASSSAVYNAGSAASISADLSGSNDAATANLGGRWTMPTKDNFQELIDNCTCTWYDDYGGTGVAGRLFTSNINGNTVFFPAAGRYDGSSVGYVGSDGYYWSASWYDSSFAWFLNFGSRGVYVGDSGFRSYGFSVRGVCE